MPESPDSKSKLPDSKAVRLEKIKAEIIESKVCPELAEGATQLVFGDGNPDADVVFIGEAPGKNEDLQGLPFVGAAGKLLDEMLKQVGMKREDVYITNIVKYRPPGNRDPYPDEKAAFLPYLRVQLQVINPKLIVTLGRHSMDALLPGLRISECHGQPKRIRVASGGLGASMMQGDKGVTFDKSGKTSLSKSQLTTSGEKRTKPYEKYGEGASQPATKQRAASDSGIAGSAGKQAVTSWVILPLFHPAAALYNGSMRSTLMDDFMRIPKVLAKI